MKCAPKSMFIFVVLLEKLHVSAAGSAIANMQAKCNAMLSL
jgi:hypothetical protein